MGVMRLGRVTRERSVRSQLRAAFTTNHPPHLVGASFAVGLFFTALPTFGAAIPFLAWLGYRFEWASGLAFSAAITVLNPLAKGSVYVASFLIGVALLGPIPGIARADIGLDAGRDVLARILLGNAILAVVFALAGYVVAVVLVRGVRRHRR